jgi:ribonuclease D
VSEVEQRSHWPQPDTDYPLEEVQEVTDWLDGLRGRQLAVDLEADGMFRYRANLCTIQLADPESIAVVDTLAVSTRDALGDVLADPGVCKVIHDVSFDGRLLAAEGVSLDNVFDTSVAVRFLGYQGTGLSAVVEHHFGVELNKTQQHADWGKRPLDARAMGYLCEDVKYLLRLSQILSGELEDADIVEEFDEECTYVVGRAVAAGEDTRHPWMRVKGAVKLPPKQRAVLREVAGAREAIAERRDVPAGRLIPSGILVAMAERPPSEDGQLVKALRRGRLTSEEREELLDAVARGKEASDVPADELAELKPKLAPAAERARAKNLRTALTNFRTEQCEARGVDPQVVLPGHCLKDLLSVPAGTDVDLGEIEGFGACRVERYGKTIRSLVAAATD